MNAVANVQPHVYLGIYEVASLLGQGGMGQVYLGVNRRTREKVVIKVMHAHLAANPGVRSQFVHEAKMMQTFRHPNAVRLLDASVDANEKSPCIVMEYIQGVSLERLLAQGVRLILPRAVKILGQLAPVIDAAHRIGLLHRDLTLANVMVVAPDTPQQQIKVMDFGLAQGNGLYIALEKFKGPVDTIGGGTPDYICPEQIKGQEIDHRADLYSVGVLLYRILTGRLPFEEEQNVQSILKAHLEKTAPSFASLRVTGIPTAIEKSVFRLLAKNPTERPSSMREVVQEWEKALRQTIVPAKAWEETTDQVKAPPPVPSKSTNVLDRVEAWMPEQIAIVKLKGFVEGVGGEIVESQPGSIRVHLFLDEGPSPSSSGFWQMFRGEKPPPRQFIEIHLGMQKRTQGTRSMVEITVSRKPGAIDQTKPRTVIDGYCQRVCRELRAYLMTGR